MDIHDPQLMEHMRSKTVMGTLGIDLVEATAESVVVEMNVSPRVHQPYGFLHGGVSVVLAETAASIGAWIAAGLDRAVFGIEINANHLRTIRDGRVRATATAIRNGATVAVWAIEITDQDGAMVCIARCTLAVRDHRDL